MSGNDGKSAQRVPWLFWRKNEGSSPEPEGQNVAAIQGHLPGRLAGLSLPRQVLALAIWPFIEQVLNFMVGYVDTMVAGHLSVDALKAVAVGSYVGWLFQMIQMSVGIGATAVISRAVGGRRMGLATAAVGQAMTLAILVGCVTGVLFYMAAPMICAMQGIEGQARDYCETYLRIMALASPLSSVVYVSSACLRAAGDTRSPFLVLVVVNLVNSTCTYLFVFGPAPLGGHGVAGIQWGTNVAWLVGAILITLTLASGWGAVRLRARWMWPHAHTLRRIGKVALGSLAESGGLWCGNFLVLYMVGLVAKQPGQDAALAAHLIGVRVEAISYLPCVALGIASATLTGQYLGMGDVRRAIQATGLCLLLGVTLMSVAGVVFFLFAHPLVGLVTQLPAVLELAPITLLVCAPVQPLFAVSIVLSNALRGAGDTRTTMMLTYGTIFLVRVPLVWLLGVRYEMGLKGVWIALCIELAVRGLAFGARYLHGGWARVKV